MGVNENIFYTSTRVKRDMKVYAAFVDLRGTFESFLRQTSGAGMSDKYPKNLHTNQN